MKFALKILTAFFFTVSVFATSYAQTKSIAAISDSRKLVRKVGKADVFYDEKQDQTESRIFLYLIGNAMSVFQGGNSLPLEMGYKVLGKKATEPDFVYLHINSYSH